MTSAGKLLLLLAVASVLSCGDTSGPPAPTPGTLLLHLTTPHDDDAALLLHLTGPSIAPPSVAAATGAQQLFAQAATGGGVNVALFGSLGAGPLLRMQVPDVSRASEYRVTVLEAADSSNALRAGVSGYSGQFVKD
jgi:hypothetical protein